MSRVSQTFCKLYQKSVIGWKITASQKVDFEEEIKIGDVVTSIKGPPYHDGTIMRFSKDGSFAFIRTASGKEETKRPENLAVVSHGREQSE